LKAVFFLIIVLILSTSPEFVCTAETNKSSTLEVSSRQEAKELWEQAVLAKGGRDKLQAVSNMLASSRIKGRKYIFKPITLHYENFFVFPYRSWSWIDERESGLFGLKVEMLNLERNLSYLTYPNDPESPRVFPICPDCTDKRYSIIRAQLRFLMESHWVRPVPLGMSRESIEFKQVDVVQTLVNGERVDFALDQKSHLPLKFSHYYKFRGEEIIYTESMSDYVEVSGIKVPKKFTKYGFKHEVEYQINIPYTERLFEHPPTIEAGPDAWKANRK
jgi:hypothetical protein